MADRKWQGGATAVSQVDHLTPGGTIEADDLFIVTLTAEDGSTTQSISVAAGGTTVADVCTAVQTEADGSSQSLFQAITWTEDGSKVIATAGTAGVPFYCTVDTTEAGGGAADSQTFVRSSNTANAGPNDWNTAGNWSGSTVPVNSDNVFIFPRETEYDILYGLDQSGVTLGRLTYTIPKKAGDQANGYALRINGSTLQINSNSQYVNIDGTWPTVLVNSIGRGTSTQPSLILDGDVDNLYFTGQSIRGPVRLKTGMVLDNVYSADCPSLVLDLQSGVTSIDLLELTTGTGDIKSASTTMNISGGSWTNTGTVGTLAVKGGRLNHKDGNITTSAAVHAGTLELIEVEDSDITIEAMTVYGGVYRELGTGDSVTYTNNIVAIGGSVTANSGVTLSV